MMAGVVDGGGGGAASSVRMTSDNASDASDDDCPVFADFDTRKRKGLSFAAPEVIESGSDRNKRVRQQSASEYSGFYSDRQQGATSAEETPEVDTSFDSRGDTSAFSSGEEGFSQRPDPFMQHKPGAFKQGARQADSWSGERNLLQLQLGSFIRKEKLRLESESETSIHSLTSSGYDVGVESSAHGDRDHSGNTLSGNSLSGYMRGSTSSAASSDNTGYYSSRTSSILSSVVRNNKKKDHEMEERASLTHMIHLSRPSLSAAQQVLNSQASVHQKFVLSSGRPSNVTAAREDTRVNTIDRDFDEYFAKLML